MIPITEDQIPKINKTMMISKAQQKLVLLNNHRFTKLKSQILTNLILEIQNKMKKQRILLK